MTPWWLTCLGDSRSCGDSSDVLLASASQSVLPSIALQDFICAHLWPHAFSGDKRTDADQATAVEWIVYDQRNEKRVCMNATSRSHLTVGWSGEGSYLSVLVFDHHVILFAIDQSTSFPYAILVTSSRDHQASNLSRPKETRPVKGWGWLRLQTGGFSVIYFCDLSVVYLMSARDTMMIDVSRRLSLLWWQFGCFTCFSLTISLAIDRTSRFYLCSPVTPCLFRWQKNRRWSSDSCRVNCVWSKKRETSVHERDEYRIYLP